jgi:two-component system OmpR family response regulator
MEGNARRVLVIEDDPDTAEQLVDCLRTGGYKVDLASDGDKGLALGRTADYVVMTVDRMLPRVDGLEVIQRLREHGIVSPTLIISALGEVDDRVRGLRAGGDDYLVKPFAFAELLARVDALARRSATVVKETTGLRRNLWVGTAQSFELWNLPGWFPALGKPGLPQIPHLRRRRLGEKGGRTT